jgi:hypothetical protein
MMTLGLPMLHGLVQLQMGRRHPWAVVCVRIRYVVSSTVSNITQLTMCGFNIVTRTPVVFLVDEFALNLDKDRTTNPLPTVTQMLTVCTNVLVTGLISFHLYRARRTLSRMLPTPDTRLYTGPVAILVESAVPLTVLGPITAGLQLAPFPKNQIAAQALVATYYIIGGLFYSFCVSSR